MDYTEFTIRTVITRKRVYLIHKESVPISLLYFFNKIQKYIKLFVAVPGIEKLDHIYKQKKELQYNVDLSTTTIFHN